MWHQQILQYLQINNVKTILIIFLRHCNQKSGRPCNLHVYSIQKWLHINFLKKSRTFDIKEIVFYKISPFKYFHKTHIQNQASSFSNYNFGAFLFGILVIFFCHLYPACMELLINVCLALWNFLSFTFLG